MKLLALETSTIACSVALARGAAVYEQHEVKPREHTRLLVPMIRRVLADAGVEAGELDAVVLGNGPGSFIGMRIAGSVAQGLAFGSRRGIVALSSLAAIAAEVFDTTAVDRVMVAQDAHMNEVYLARYARGSDDLPLAEGETVLQPASRIDASEWQHTTYAAAGAGWQRYPELLEVNAGLVPEFIEVALPRARYLLPMARAALRTAAPSDPAALVPDYVRHKVASPPGGKDGS